MDDVGLKGSGEREVWPDIGQLVLKRSCKSLFSDFRFSSLPLKLCKRRQLDKLICYIPGADPEGGPGGQWTPPRLCNIPFHPIKLM